MRRLSRFVLLMQLGIVSACSSTPPKPPEPESGARQPVNSEFALQILRTHERRESEGGLARYERERQAELQASFDAERRRYSRPVDPATLGDLPGNRGVTRIVSVQFPFNSTAFKPTPAQAFQLRELLSSATRVEVRGRTDGIGELEADQAIARARAMSAKRYLIARGIPHDLIGVSFLAGGDYLGDNGRLDGRRINRRVDVEFHLPDLPPLPNGSLSSGRSASAAF